MITFLGCDGEWVAGANAPVCSGDLQTFTAQELLSSQKLSDEDFQQMSSVVVLAFTTALVFVSLKRIFW